MGEKPVGAPNTGQGLAPVVALVLHWNDWKDTIDCLESLQRVRYPLHRVVAIDNGSTNDSVDRVKAWAQGDTPATSPLLGSGSRDEPVAWIEYDQAEAEAGGSSEREAVLDGVPANRRLVIVHNRGNLGFAGGMNVGIRYACRQGAQYIWLLNNDTVAGADALRPLVEVMQERDSTGMAGPQELSYDNPRQVVGSIGFVYPWRGATGGIPRDLRPDGHGRVDVELLSGFNLLVRAATIDSVGLMDERFFLYAEETEWCVRMRRSGWKLVYVPEAKVWHKGSRSTGWASPLMYYYTTRNQLHLFATHFPYAVPCVMVRSGLRMVKLLTQGRWSACLATARGCLDWAAGRSGMIRRCPPGWRSQPACRDRQ